MLILFLLFFFFRIQWFFWFEHSIPTGVSRQVPSAAAPLHLSVVSGGGRHQIVLCLRDGDVPAAWEVGSAAAGRERCIGCPQVWFSGCWSAYNIRTDLMKFGCASAGRCVEGVMGVVQTVETGRRAPDLFGSTCQRCTEFSGRSCWKDVVMRQWIRDLSSPMLMSQARPGVLDEPNFADGHLRKS